MVQYFISLDIKFSLIGVMQEDGGVE